MKGKKTEEKKRREKRKKRETARQKRNEKKKKKKKKKKKERQKRNEKKKKKRKDRNETKKKNEREKWQKKKKKRKEENLRTNIAGTSSLRRNITACPKCPAEVREEIREYMTKKKKEKEEMNMLPHFDELANAYEEDEEDDVEVIERGKRPLAHGSEVSSARGSTTISTVSKTKKPKQKGPIDVFFTPNPDVVVQNRKAQGKQTRIDANDPYRKELREQACIRFARWMYDAGIPFNAVNCDSFGLMIEAIGQYGPSMKPRSYHEVRVPLLKKEIEHTNNLMKGHRDDWVNYSKDAEKMFQLIEKFVERIGEANVVQIVTDSAAANVLAGKFLEAKFAHLYWTPCAAHCLDLMLEDIFKIPSLKRAFERAIVVHGFIYNRPTLLNMMRRFTQMKELIKPAKPDLQPPFSL
ncbi:hypothetical protein CKAN_00369600 [Cinnamomum micranthum f. kanehirae]|uniref:DUF659 domain-containing protein n=1 Tax=Cinnamomum micranthum f. kanehirae TaxID=337451 RepID=A0A3S3M8X3_9MAGN|nr:hypothetical protein CKAN_00369600 [Cinnamomum micranthum f. kanehirae]